MTKEELVATRSDIEAKLYRTRFRADNDSHLIIKDQEVCRSCEEKPCMVFCPAAVYDWDDERKMTLVAFEGCLECGACRIGCPYGNIEWLYPRGGFGVQFRMG
ncbi:MAG: 4Fe-4S dicluster domain-containing protein [Bacillota bacterium]|nr:4Fe-4S dicluster domain-containing protein [Bacillota bacterium]